MEKMYTREQVEKISGQCFMRGMMIQYEADTNTNTRKPHSVFEKWLKELIDTVDTRSTPKD